MPFPLIGLATCYGGPDESFGVDIQKSASESDHSWNRKICSLRKEESVSVSENKQAEVAL